MRTAYLTATFDILHEDHVRLLKACKERCDYLIVGLVSDELAVRQKRQTLFTYEHRRCLLEHSKYVDLVVPHDGQSKYDAWQLLKFNILFTTDEYYRSNEFKAFPADELQVQVIYMPKNTSISSTKLLEKVMKRLSESETILCTSLSGYITKSGFKPYTVSKPIHFAREEMILNDTSDCFGFYRYPSLPRNWKKKTNEEPSEHFPNLPGINSQREIALNQYLKGRPFCTYLYHVVVYNKEQTDTTHAPGPEPTPHSPETLTLQAFAQKVFEARMYPEKIVKLIQMDAGVTFEYWAEYVCASKEEFVQVTDRVEAILAELRLEGIVHADPHPRNVLIDCTSDRKVSLIDFGWSLMRGFQMCAVEQQAFNHMIQSNFDLHHFRQSLEFCKATNMWLKK